MGYGMLDVDKKRKKAKKRKKLSYAQALPVSGYIDDMAELMGSSGKKQQKKHPIVLVVEDKKKKMDEEKQESAPMRNWNEVASFSSS